MSKRLFALLAAVLAITMIAAGCGGGDDDGDSLTKAQLIEQADAICEKGDKEIEEETEAFAEDNGIDLNKEPTQAEQEELITEVIAPAVRQQGEEIGDLGAPSGEEETVAAIAEAVESAAEEAEEDPAPLIEGEEGGFAKANELAEDYGFKVCGEG